MKRFFLITTILAIAGSIFLAFSLLGQVPNAPSFNTIPSVYSGPTTSNGYPIVHADTAITATVNADGNSTTNILIAATNILTQATNLITQATNLLSVATNLLSVATNQSSVATNLLGSVTNLLTAVTNNQQTATNSGYTSSNPFVVSNTAPGGTISLPSGATNGQGQLIISPTNTVSVGVTNDPITEIGVTNKSGTSLYITNQNTTPIYAIVTNATTAPVPVVQQGTVTVTPTAGTNQINFNVIATNVVNNITNAGVVGNVAWVATNAAFNVAGGSGALMSIDLCSATNQDYLIKVYAKVVTASTPGSATSVTRADRQYMIGMWSTGTSGNTNFSSGWFKDNTNWLCHLGNLAAPAKNADASVNIVLEASYLDTKTNYTASDTLIRTAFMNDK